MWVTRDHRLDVVKKRKGPTRDVSSRVSKFLSDLNHREKECQGGQAVFLYVTPQWEFSARSIKEAEGTGTCRTSASY